MLRLACAVLLVCGVLRGDAAGQETDGELRPAFSLSSSEIFTSRDNPSFYLTFRHLPRLDFRVYRVKDAAALFRGLRDPHQLGSSEYEVPTERSWIERLTDWKRAQRQTIRTFVRDQVTFEYRAQRRAARDRVEVAQRVTLNRSTFAQVPLLNPDQLVTSWREILPDLRDAELRRIPLQVTDPGIYVVEAVSDALRAYTIVMVSDLGLVTKVSPGQALVFAANRLTGEPQPGCDVQLLANSEVVARGATAADGVLTTVLPTVESDELVTLAQCGDQATVTDPGGYYLRQPTRELLGYIYTDKPIYRPGHTVHAKAVLRLRERDALRGLDRSSVELTASDVNDKVVYRQVLPVDEFGAVGGAFMLPMTATLGNYTLRIASGDQTATGSFEVQEYVRPEFEVVVAPAASRFVVQGQQVIATVQARYYFGQPVANAQVRYVVNRQSYFSPYRYTDEAEGDEGGFFFGDDQNATGEIRLDAQGRGEIRVPTAVDANGQDYSLRIEAQVTDASSRQVSNNTVMHATHGAFLLTADTGGYVFRPGQRVTTSIRALDYSGNPRPGVAVSVVVERLVYQNYYTEPAATPVGRATATLDAVGRGEAQVTLGQEAGSYRIRVTAASDGRTIAAQTFAWVPGREDVGATEGDRYLELLADKRTYAPGDVARVVVRGDAVSGPVLLTKEGQQVTWHRLVSVDPSAPLEVPIDAADIGDIYVSVVYMRDGRLNRAERRLTVPATERTLQIALTADRAVAKPQEPGVFTVSVRDAVGMPVRAQVSLGVIDEAVYAIRPDGTPDPVRFFHRREYSRVSTSFSRDYYFTGFSGSERLQLATRRRRPFTLADFKGDKAVQPQVRKEFPDAIYWIGSLVTDANGTAKVAVKYPDALTTWRLTARAVTTDTRAGTGVVRTTTTKDLIVRVITPRFLTEGDELALPTIVHNYLPDPKDASIALESKGLEPTAGASTAPRSGSIASGAERRDDWRLTAPAVGTATITATARTNTDTDAVELPVPVLPYGLRRESGSSGALREGADATAAVTIPATSNPAGRTVRVSLAPSIAGSMLGALDFLTSYPYGCTEQTLSSFLPNLVVSRALTQLKLAPAERLSVLDRQTADGLRRLLDYQHDDGGWGWWRTDENHPFMTAYALYGLTEARREGYEVDAFRVQQGIRALAAMYAQFPDAQAELKAYVVFVLNRAAAGRASIDYRTEDGQAGVYQPASGLDAVWDARDRMSAYGRALLLLALDDARDARGNDLAARLAAEAQTRGDLSFWTSDRDPLLFDVVDTSVEATATAVRALARRDPGNPLLDRAVRWLMLNRSGGYWISTKQTAFALYGLLEVLRARDETPQTFTADVFVNGALAGSRTFTPASVTDPDPVVIDAGARAGANDVRIVKRGGGTLYWSATGISYDPRAAEARSGSRQLALTRSYAKLTAVRQANGNIVYREQPITGPVNPGDVLTVRLVAAGSRDWRYLVLEDPLPAGVEAVQDTTAYPLERPGTNPWWSGSRVEYRDSRTVFFQPDFDDGRYEFSYLVRVTSSGDFRAVPAQIAPMYVPGVAASSEPFRLTVAPAAETQR